MKKAIDMTVGSPFKNLLIFAIPIAISFMLQQLYSLGDALIVSLSRGADAATGINVTGSITFLVLGFSQGISAGFGIVLSQFVGAKDEEKMHKSLATSIVSGIAVAVILSLTALIFTRPLLVLLQTNEKFIEYANDYLITIFAGLTFSMLYNMSDQFMRAMGDSRTPLIILLLCAVLNLGLNSLLFVVDSFGVEWAGWATVISQGISAVIGFFIIFKKFKVLRLKKSDFKFSARFALQHFAVGIPMAVQFMITASGCMFQQRAFNMLPDDRCAIAQGMASKIDNIFGAILNGAGTAMATYAGQNYGAKNYLRIKKGFYAALLSGLIFTAVSVFGCLVTALPFSKVLLPGADEETFSYVKQYIIIQSAFYYALYLIYMIRPCIQAMGRGDLAVIGGIIEFAVRTIVSFTIAVYFGFTGACFSNVLAWLGAAVYLVVIFYIVINGLIKKQAEMNEIFN